MSVAVVVVTYSPGESLGTFLSTLEASTERVVPVVLADNASTDGIPQDAATKHDQVSLVEMGRNLGYGAAANRGVRATDTELVLIANPDIVWSTGALDTLADAAARWPGAGALGPLIRNTDGEIYPSARALPSLGRGIGHALAGWWWPSNPWTTAYRNERGAPQEGSVGWLSGSCLLVRRAAFDAVGGFDPEYFMYFEDVDLGERLGRGGWQNVYVPSAEVTHVGAHATGRDPRRMATEHHRSAWRWVRRHYPGLWWAPVRLVLRAGLATRAALARRAPAVAAGARPNPRTP
jgi:N-acetylglucosaminyl-diphospho-decaprenol L-rhamnosyltransferase